MPTKEGNRVRMRGVLPSYGAGPIPVGKIPDGAVQIAKWAVAENNVVSIHTVTVGKTFYLTSIVLTFRNAAAAAFTGQFYINDDLGALTYVVSTCWLPASGTELANITFMPPFELPSAYDLIITSNGVGFRTYMFIHGYEI